MKTMIPQAASLVALSGLLTSLPLAADPYEDLLVKQSPLVYFPLNDLIDTENAAAAIDNTSADYLPLATFGDGVEPEERAFDTIPVEPNLIPSEGFEGFDAANEWVYFATGHEGIISPVAEAADDTPGGMRDSQGSVSMWINFTTAATQMLYYGTDSTGGDGFGGENELHINTTDTGAIQFYTNTQGNAISRTLTTEGFWNDGEWHHVAATWNATADVMNLFIDGGEAAGGETLTIDMGNVDDNVEFTGGHLIGRPNNNTRHYVGWMDAVALWSRQLTETEIRYQYEVAVTGGVDSEPDGMSDAFELAYFGTLDRDGTGDFDSDGLSDADEFAAGTDPTLADTDGDGLTDDVETGTGTDNGASDTGSDPLVADTDGDGLTDGDEVNTHGTDPNLVDSDGDGMDDNFEITYFGDQDEKAGGDFDSDELANIFETGTGVYEDEENTGTNPAQADTDGDGLLDGAEVNLGTSPFLADSDSDGLSDSDEVNTHGTDPNLVDSDEDGISDSLEIEIGSNPNDTGDPGEPLTSPFLGGGTWEMTTVRDDGNATDTLQEALLLVNPNITTGGGTIQGGIRNVTSPTTINHSINGAGDAVADIGNYLPDTQLDTSGFTPVGTNDAGTNVATIVEGEILIPEDGTYTFLTNSDDGHRLRINGIEGEILILDPAPHSPQNFLATIELSRGFHTIQLVHFNSAAGGGIELAMYKIAAATDTFTVPQNFELLSPFDPTDDDGDGMPDQWETLYFGDADQSDATTDSDGDGLFDSEEFTARTDPTVEDTDGDGLNDFDEVKTHESDPRLVDSDSDLLEDADEISRGLDPNVFDVDGDSFGDGAEVNAGSDPDDAASFPSEGSIIWVTNGDNGAEIELTDPDSKYFGEPNEFGFIRLLRAQGYGVALRDAGVNGYNDTDGGPNVTEANAADLIIISRNNSSGEYSANNAAWNSITTPIVSLSSYIARNSRLGWLPAGQEAVDEFNTADWEAVVPSDPAFAGLDVTTGDIFEVVRSSVSVNSGVGDLGNGTLIAQTEGSATTPTLVRWDGGVPFFEGGGTPAAPRVLFQAGLGGPNPTPGAYDLTEFGEDMLLNVVADFISEPVDGPFEAWIEPFREDIIEATGNTGDLRSTADPDQDGFTNLEELIFDLDPTVDSRPGIGSDPNSGNLPQLVEEDGEYSIRFGSDPANLSGGSTGSSEITLRGETSPDLIAPWTAVSPVSLGGGQFSIPLPSGDPKHFGRLFYEDPN